MTGRGVYRKHWWHTPRRLSRRRLIFGKTNLTIPTGLIATPSNNLVSLAWDVIDPAEDGVRIERSGDGIAFGAIFDKSTDGNTFDDNTAINGTAYYYRIRTFTSSPAAESDPSNVAGPVTPNAGSSLISPTLTHPYSTPTLIRFSWLAAVGGTGSIRYDIYRNGVLYAFNVTSPYNASIALAQVTLYTWSLKTTDDLTTATSNVVAGGLEYDGTVVGGSGINENVSIEFEDTRIS